MFLYDCTYVSDSLQQNVLLDVLHNIGLTGPDQHLPAAMHAVHGSNRCGARIDYCFNYSAAPVTFAWQEAHPLIDDHPNSRIRGQCDVR